MNENVVALKFILEFFALEESTSVTRERNVTVTYNFCDKNKFIFHRYTKAEWQIERKITN
jgi:hypothetical protein